MNQVADSDFVAESVKDFVGVLETLDEFRYQHRSGSLAPAAAARVKQETIPDWKDARALLPCYFIDLFQFDDRKDHADGHRSCFRTF